MSQMKFHFEHEPAKRIRRKASRPLTAKEVAARGMLLRMLRRGPCSYANAVTVAEARGIAEGLPGAVLSIGATVKDGKLEMPPNVAAIFPPVVRGDVLKTRKSEKRSDRS